MAAYYCFISFGWPPSKWDALPFAEKVLILEFVKKHNAECEKRKAGS